MLNYSDFVPCDHMGVSSETEFFLFNLGIFFRPILKKKVLRSSYINEKIIIERR